MTFLDVEDSHLQRLKTLKQLAAEKSALKESPLKTLNTPELASLSGLPPSAEWQRANKKLQKLWDTPPEAVSGEIENMGNLVIVNCAFFLQL